MISYLIFFGPTTIIYIAADDWSYEGRDVLKTALNFIFMPSGVADAESLLPHSPLTLLIWKIQKRINCVQCFFLSLLYSPSSIWVILDHCCIVPGIFTENIDYFSLIEYFLRNFIIENRNKQDLFVGKLIHCEKRELYGAEILVTPLGNHLHIDYFNQYIHRMRILQFYRLKLPE